MCERKRVRAAAHTDGHRITLSSRFSLPLWVPRTELGCQAYAPWNIRFPPESLCTQPSSWRHAAYLCLFSHPTGRETESVFCMCLLGLLHSPKYFLDLFRYFNIGFKYTIFYLFQEIFFFSFGERVVGRGDKVSLCIARLA